MKYADIKYFDVVNGEGVRVSLYVSGCSHMCKGCFNYNTWNPLYGKEFTEEVKEQIFEYIQDIGDTIKGISILGGDPTYHSNIKPLSEFIKEFKIRFPEKNVWLWSGYTWEEILCNDEILGLISLVDTLVEGKFDEDKKDLKLKFRGSSNQRIIRVQEELKKKYL